MPNGTPAYRAFTATNTGRANRLLSDADIVYNNNTIKVRALWDTGATSTCISHDVARQLAMTPTGMQTMHTPAGLTDANTYLVNIILPNHVQILDVVVCDSDIGAQGIGVLIGMDIILHGDLAISNYDNKTMFSFRVPSKQHTDYVKQIQVENIIGPKHGNKKKR